MNNSKIDALLKHKVSWLEDGGPDEDIAISSRIRLARNISGVSFPIAASPEQLSMAQTAAEMAIEKSQCLDSSAICFRMDELSEINKQLLLERRLVSREFITKDKNASLCVRDDEACAIMINEEDHLRIQALRPGFQLEAVWQTISELDSQIEKQLTYAYDSQLGYLTSCPTNVGTGMRASVMLHLPGLVLSGQLNAAIQGISKLGMAVRGIFGEGSDNRGNLFQVSNQSTLGESEEQIIERLNSVIKQLISHEKNARLTLLEKKQNFLLDHVGRSYGILRHAYILTSEEALNSLSGIRIGVDMGMFTSVDLGTVNELFLTINPAHLQRFAQKELNSEERDVFRASMIRERLKSISNGQ
ncbi:MAG: protein arginine kinase [Victivallaceae bacterium]